VKGREQREMVETSGGCYCGNILITASFSQYLATFEPRACAAPNGKLANICKTGAFDRSPVRFAQ
jgi:hypothetical protein